MILNATEAVYQWLLFLRGKNGGIVRNRANFGKLFAIAVFLLSSDIIQMRKKLIQHILFSPYFVRKRYRPQIRVRMRGTILTLTGISIIYRCTIQ